VAVGGDPTPSLNGFDTAASASVRPSPPQSSSVRSRSTAHNSNLQSPSFTPTGQLNARISINQSINPGFFKVAYVIQTTAGSTRERG